MSQKLNEIVNDNEGIYQRKNLEYIQSLDMKTLSYNKSKKMK